MNRFSDKRKHAYRFGLRAETLCAFLLRLKGYRVLARRYLTPFGEIDLVAERFGTLAFIEVKARQKSEDGALAVTADKRQRIARAASSFLASMPKYAGHVQRFDLMLCPPRRFPSHRPDAWRV
jgi:putative endonuclease